MGIIISRDQDVIGTLESIAEDVMGQTGFFRNGASGSSELRMQTGIARTNCIDCLDRTNAAQFVIGKRALGHQLHALGIIDDTSIDYDTDAVNLFTHMWVFSLFTPHKDEEYQRDNYLGIMIMETLSPFNTEVLTLSIPWKHIGKSTNGLAILETW